MQKVFLIDFLFVYRFDRIVLEAIVNFVGWQHCRRSRRCRHRHDHHQLPSHCECYWHGREHCWTIEHISLFALIFRLLTHDKLNINFLQCKCHQNRLVVVVCLDANRMPFFFHFWLMELCDYVNKRYLWWCGVDVGVRNMCNLHMVVDALTMQHMEPGPNKLTNRTKCTQSFVSSS